MEDELLAAIARDPEDPAAYLVLADHLQARGTPRGELMTLQQSTEERPGDHRISDAALEHVRAHAELYLGELARFVDEPQFLELGWRCGFIASAVLTWNRRSARSKPSVFEVSPEHVLATLFELDAARFLTRLVVEPTHELDARFIGRTLGGVPATLRELWLGPRDPQSALRDCRLGELTLRLPHLRTLAIHGELAGLPELALPAVQALTLILHGDHARALRDVAVAAWPRLERLQVWNALPGSLEPLLQRDDLVTLGELGIVNSAFADRLCGMLPRTPIAAQLYRLSFARGALTDAGVDLLVDHAARFPSLATIDVSETFVTPRGLARLRTLAPEVVGRDLRTGPPRPLVPPRVRDPDD